MDDGLQEEQMIRLAVDWIVENSARARAAPQEITASTELLKVGVLDSLGLVDLIAFLEKTTGHEIDLLELDEDDLGTLQGLCRAARDAATVS